MTVTPEDLHRLAIKMRATANQLDDAATDMAVAALAPQLRAHAERNRDRQPRRVPVSEVPADGSHEMRVARMGGQWGPWRKVTGTIHDPDEGYRSLLLDGTTPTTCGIRLQRDHYVQVRPVRDEQYDEAVHERDHEIPA